MKFTASLIVSALIAVLSAQEVRSQTKEVLQVCVTTPDVASLAIAVGGELVAVTSLSQGTEDPHEIELKPSFVKLLKETDLFIQVGLGIENAWLSDLMKAVSRPEVGVGGTVNLNLGIGVNPLEGEVGGKVPDSYHEDGNPHYLLDPIEGYRAAQTIARKLSELSPEGMAAFDKNLERFRVQLVTALAGEECADDDPLEVVAEFESALASGEMEAFRKKHQLGGWLARSLPYRGKPVVGDHDLWPYFARRYGLKVLAYLEPSPGVPPTTRHLSKVIAEMKAQGVPIVLTAPYFNPRYATLVSGQTGAKVLPTVHQTGGRKEAKTYLEMLGYNFDVVFSALEER